MGGGHVPSVPPGIYAHGSQVAKTAYVCIGTSAVIHKSSPVASWDRKASIRCTQSHQSHPCSFAYSEFGQSNLFTC